MKAIIYTLILFPFIVGCQREDKAIASNETKDSSVINQNDSVWTYTAYKRGKLRVDITNHNQKNFSIHIQRNTESLDLDLNALNIPWKTPDVNWVNDEMICISNWWSGPFARYIFIPLKGKLAHHIYLDKDIELADSLTNTIVYIDSVKNESTLVLAAENVVTRKKKLIEVNIPADKDLYPHYDSLTIRNSSLVIWINGKPVRSDLKSIH